MKRMGGWALGLGLSVIFLSACSAGAGDPPPRSYAFVTNNYSGSVSAFVSDTATGALTEVVGSPFKAGYGSVGIALDPSGKFAYVAGGGVSALTIDPATGALAAVDGSPFPAGDGPRSIAIDPSGKFVYVGGYTGYYPVSGISALAIDPATGALTAVAGSPFDTGSLSPYALAVDPSGKFVYAVSGGSIPVYAIDAATGALSAIAGSPFTSTFEGGGIAIDPSGKFVYVGGYSRYYWEYGVFALAVDPATGALAVAARYPFPAGDGPLSISVDPSGRFFYVASRSSNHVSAFLIDAATGALTAVAGSPFAAGDEPSAVAVDPSGKFVYVANHYSNNVSAFAINLVTGALSAVRGSPFGAGERPSGLAVVRIAQ